MRSFYNSFTDLTFNTTNLINKDSLSQRFKSLGTGICVLRLFTLYLASVFRMANKFEEEKTA